MNPSDGLDILLVEDNPDHAEFTLRALADGDTTHRTHWVKDGEEALNFLRRERQWTDAPRPQLILLDINLPKLTGHEVLRLVKTDDDLRSIPVVMLTTSSHAEEVEATYQSGANSYVTKPVKFIEFMKQVKALKDYWTLTSRLPAVA